jgi:hypothetical protein
MVVDGRRKVLVKVVVVVASRGGFGVVVTSNRGGFKLEVMVLGSGSMVANNLYSLSGRSRDYEQSRDQGRREQQSREGNSEHSIVEEQHEGSRFTVKEESQLQAEERSQTSVELTADERGLQGARRGLLPM